MENILKDNQKFYIQNDDKTIALLEYTIDGKVMSIDHTFVEPELQGKGIAAQLTEKAIEFAKSNDLKIRPLCKYAKYYFSKHPEYSDLIAK